MEYVSSSEHALVDYRPYLPEEWAKAPKRCRKAGVPKGLGYKTRHELALKMLDHRGAILPHNWVSGDDEMGRPAWFRRALHRRHERYLLAVPSNTCVRDLEADPPKSSGQGRPKKRPFQTVRAWRESLPAEAWTRLTVRDGDKGPLEVEITACWVESKFERGVADFEETLVVIRGQVGDTIQHDYYFSMAIGRRPWRSSRGWRRPSIAWKSA